MKLLNVTRTTLTTKITKFLNFYKAYGQTGRVDTKVAIIDNGVDSTLPTLSKAVIAGVSLDEDFSGRQDPWWLASHPHGTQMANFVHQLDPFCHLYIAKVCDQATCIDPDIVADVSRESSWKSHSVSDQARQSTGPSKRGWISFQ